MTDSIPFLSLLRTSLEGHARRSWHAALVASFQSEITENLQARRNIARRG
jgi:hypothetical protein